MGYPVGKSSAHPLQLVQEMIHDPPDTPHKCMLQSDWPLSGFVEPYGEFPETRRRGRKQPVSRRVTGIEDNSGNGKRYSEVFPGQDATSKRTEIIVTCPLSGSLADYCPVPTVRGTKGDPV